MIKLGIQAPRSGPLTPLGDAFLAGVQLALEQSNSKRNIEQRGFRVELISYDDEGKPDRAVEIARRASRDEIRIVLGPATTSTAAAAAAAYANAKVVAVTPAPLVGEISLPRGVFSVGGRAGVQGSLAAKFARADLNAKTASVVHDGSPYSREVAEFFAATISGLGTKVLSVNDTSQISLETLIARIKTDGPDLVFFDGPLNPSGQTQTTSVAFTNTVRQTGSKAVILGSDRFDAPLLASAKREPGARIFYTTFGGEAVSPTWEKFTRASKERFKSPPQPLAAAGFDAATITLRALEGATTRGDLPTFEDIIGSLLKTNVEGLTGPLQFDESGERLAISYALYEVTSAEPAKWGDNKLARAPVTQACQSGSCPCTTGGCSKTCCKKK